MSATKPEERNSPPSTPGNIAQRIKTETVIGEPLEIGDAVILPIIDIFIVLGTDIDSESTENEGVVGFFGDISMRAMLVIRDGLAKLVTVDAQTPV